MRSPIRCVTLRLSLDGLPVATRILNLRLEVLGDALGQVGADIAHVALLRRLGLELLVGGHHANLYEN